MEEGPSRRDSPNVKYGDGSAPGSNEGSGLTAYMNNLGIKYEKTYRELGSTTNSIRSASPDSSSVALIAVAAFCLAFAKSDSRYSGVTWSSSESEPGSDERLAVSVSP